MKIIDIEAVSFDDDVTPLIVCYPTGVKYTMQTGGLCCNHPEIEGFVLNMPNLTEGIDDCSYGCNHLQDTPVQQKKLADVIQKHFDEYFKGMTLKIDFDYDRIKLLQEGLWPVKLTGKYFDVDINGLTGFLYTGNCD